MGTLAFLRQNFRWIAGGFLLMFFASVGQTFFIALSAGGIRAEYGLSHGEFGTLYMAMTLASAFALASIGHTVDHNPIRRVLLWVAPTLAFAGVLMAFGHHILVLAAALFLLRLFGQGMMTHLAFTAVGRWFSGQRGRAVSLTLIGINTGEGLLPLLFVFASAYLNWREWWMATAAVILFVAMPTIAWLVARERRPSDADPSRPVVAVRNWTRGEAIRDPYLYLLLIGVLAPPFVATAVFFHQVYLVELRGWTMGIFAASFGVGAATTIVAALLAGQLVDRYSALRLMPAALIPLGIASLILGLVDAPWSAFAFMALLGVTNGLALTVYGALWPEIYGTAHLGAIRAVITAMFVLSTAVGPGLTGVLIDWGVDLPSQLTGAGVWCLVVFWPMVAVSRRVLARLAAEGVVV